MADQKQPEVNRADSLAGIAHGFLGRRGGVSTGEVAGLNCGLGSGDAESAIATNRAMAAQAVLPGAALVGVYQVHSALCATVVDPWSDSARPEADALVSNRPGTLLSILTADCAPVLFADQEAGVIGAAHAGWKGAISGVTDATIAAMVALGASPSAIVAAIGPCIAQPSYEVDERFADRFISEDTCNSEFFSPGAPGHWQFDLEGYVAHRLKRAGVGRVERLRLDTYADPARFYSFRRATHRGELSYGRQISVIGLRVRPH